MEGTDLESDLTCCICLEIFREPVMLDCSHNLCLECAKPLVKYNKIVCPECRQTTNTKQGNPTLGLKKNLILRNILEKLKTGPVSSTPTTNTNGSKESCSRCEKQVATLECEDCQEVFCKVCSDNIHSGGKWKGHKIAPIGTITRLKCTEHSKDFELYCRNDNVLVCVNCVLVGKHKGHDCGTIADAASAARKQLAETLAAAVGVKDELKATLKNVNETADNILKEKAKTRNEIEKSCDELIQLINKRRELLVKELESIGTQQKEKISKQQSEIHSLINSLNAEILSLQSNLTGPDVKLLFTQQNSTIQKLMTQGSRVPKKPVVVPSFEYSFERMDEEITKFGKVTAPVVASEEIKPWKGVSAACYFCGNKSQVMDCYKYGAIAVRAVCMNPQCQKSGAEIQSESAASWKFLGRFFDRSVQP